MTKFKCSKLVRDKFPDHVERLCNGVCKFRVLEHDELREALKAKLYEEVEECLEDGSIEEIAAEFADVYEVLEALARVRGVSQQQIIAAKQHKTEERGAYSEYFWVDWIELKPKTELHDYYVARPKKYPKI